jgi:vacuolar-type H+-ATPase subunit E/Vma4
VEEVVKAMGGAKKAVEEAVEKVMEKVEKMMEEAKKAEMQVVEKVMEKVEKVVEEAKKAVMQVVEVAAIRRRASSIARAMPNPPQQLLGRRFVVWAHSRRRFIV